VPRCRLNTKHKRYRKTEICTLANMNCKHSSWSNAQEMTGCTLNPHS